MDEEQGRAENTQANIQKSLNAQQERVKRLENTAGFRNDLVGKGIKGEVQAHYEKGKGGFVRTDIRSGEASLQQDWSFDNQGKLAGVRINKRVDMKDAGRIVISRDDEGKFQVKELDVNPISRRWEEEFTTAGVKVADQTPQSSQE